MKTLKQYTSDMSNAERREFAERCGTTWPFLRNVIYGTRKPGEKLCVQLELQSGGCLTRQTLRPEDWLEIWPELAEPAHPPQQEETAHD